MQITQHDEPTIDAVTHSHAQTETIQDTLTISVSESLSNPIQNDEQFIKAWRERCKGTYPQHLFDNRIRRQGVNSEELTQIYREVRSAYPGDEAIGYIKWRFLEQHFSIELFNFFKSVHENSDLARTMADEEEILKAKKEEEQALIKTMNDTGFVFPIGELKLGEGDTNYNHALHLSNTWKGKIKWASHFGKWMQYDGTVWIGWSEERMITESADHLHKEYLLLLHGAVQTNNEKLLETYPKMLRSSCNAQAIKQALVFLKGFKEFHAESNDWDTNQWLLNLQNGTYNLKTHEFRAHDPNDLLTKKFNAFYDPTADAPLWKRHISRFLPSEDLQRQLQRDIGMALTGVPQEESLPIWFGSGANAKTTTAMIFLKLFGNYAIQAPPDLLIKRKFDEHATEIADLCGTRLVFSAETDNNRRLAEAKVKKLTGGDRQKARKMRQDFFEFDQTFRIILSTNHKPIVEGVDTGIWRRIRLVPWNVAIPVNEQRPQEIVIDEILKESSGILNWLIQGLKDKFENPSWIAEEVRVATEQYKGESDALKEFFSINCEIEQRATIDVASLYNAYSAWCSEAGEHVEEKKEFGKLMKGRGFTQKRSTGGRRDWVGIRLKEVEGDPFVDSQSSELQGDTSRTHPLSESEVENLAMNFGGKIEDVL